MNNREATKGSTLEPPLLWPTQWEKHSATPRAMSAKDGGYLSRQLLKEKVQCPSCGATLALKTLRSKHLCPRPKVVDVEARKARMVEKAIQAHILREQGKRSEDGGGQGPTLVEHNS